MGRYGLVIPLLLALGVVALSDCAPQATVTSAKEQIPAIAPGAARVWFFRGWDSLSGQGFVYGAAPVIYANGAPVGDIPTVAASSAISRRGLQLHCRAHWPPYRSGSDRPIGGRDADLPSGPVGS
jgi:hypothetical protein